jgi:maltose alpha-D-glucosyltransferase/alpha-amylase
MSLAREVLASLSQAHLPAAAAGLATVLQHNAPALLRKIKAPAIPPGTCHRQRVHGDIHLGQVLWDGKAFTILDFEGEPARPMEERRRKQSPARDLAGMLRSFDYAARAGLPVGTGLVGEQAATDWKRKARKAFRFAYEKSIGNEPFLPSDTGLRNKLVNLFELEKAFYELKYELGHRPDWVEIPLAGLLELVGPRLQEPPPLVG